MRNDFQQQDHLTSARAFWVGLAFYAALFIGAVTVVGGTVPQTETAVAWKANSTGTLIFGIREQPEINDNCGADYFLRNSHETRGALTLRSHSTFGFVSELNRRSLNDPLIARSLDPRIADLPSARTNTPRVNEPVVSRAGDLDITPMQIGSATFTLQETATTNFIINVTRQFSLSGNVKIVLAGGVQWDNVLFNVRGQGADVLLSNNARLEGILMANMRTVRLSGQSRVIGEVIAKKIVMSNGSQITHPPVVSPEQPPAP